MFTDFWDSRLRQDIGRSAFWGYEIISCNACICNPEKLTFASLQLKLSCRSEIRYVEDCTIQYEILAKFIFKRGSFLLLPHLIMALCRVLHSFYARNDWEERCMACTYTPKKPYIINENKVLLKKNQFGMRTFGVPEKLISKMRLRKAEQWELGEWDFL